MRISTIIAAIAGGFIGLGLAAAYDSLIDDPRVRAEAIKIAEGEAKKRTDTSIEEVGDDVETLRAMRRRCVDAGRLWDFEANQCRED